MALFENAISALKDSKRKRLEGDIVAIPWSLPRLSKVLPGIEQRRYVLVTASPKSGKTQVADFLYMYQPIEWLIKHPDSNVKLKIFYFSLEVSSQAKVKAAISYKLFRNYKMAISPQKLSSVYEDYILDDEVERVIDSKDFQDWFKVFEQTVTFFDSVRNPYGIFNTVRSYAETHGTYTYKKVKWKEPDGSFTLKKIRDRYIPKDPDEYVIVITDHVGLLQPEKGETLHQTINKFSAEYCLEMRDSWGYIPVIVQQQTADSSKAQFTYRGDTIIDKVKPDAEGLADSKYTARDVDLMLSLFNPTKYKIKYYEGVDLVRMGDNHREFAINLNRHGISNATVQFYFLGSSSYFSELPKEMSEKDYEKIEEINRNMY